MQRTIETSPKSARTRRAHRLRAGLGWVCLLAMLAAVPPGRAEQPEKPLPVETAEKAPNPAAVELARAVMCREISEFSPRDTAIVFSLELGKVSCFTLFDPVRKKTRVYHTWYRRDHQVTRKRLTVKPPRWSTFSSIELREADRGPWRVEITDNENRLLAVLRFSITD